MTAKEAEKLAIEQKPIYENKRVNDALKLAYKLIEETSNKGKCSFSGQWDYQEIGLPKVVEQLRSEGYYVSTGNNYSSLFHLIIAWGDDVAKYKNNDEDLDKITEGKVSKIKKKWWQIWL